MTHLKVKSNRKKHRQRPPEIGLDVGKGIRGPDGINAYRRLEEGERLETINLVQKKKRNGTCPGIKGGERRESRLGGGGKGKIDLHPEEKRQEENGRHREEGGSGNGQRPRTYGYKNRAARHQYAAAGKDQHAKHENRQKRSGRLGTHIKISFRRREFTIRFFMTQSAVYGSRRPPGTLGRVHVRSDVNRTGSDMFQGTRQDRCIDPIVRCPGPRRRGLVGRTNAERQAGRDRGIHECLRHRLFFRSMP